MPHPERRARAARLIVALIAALMAVPAPVLTPAARASNVIRAYTPRFEATDRGSIALIGNTLMTCPASGGATCTSARAGTASAANNNNNAWTMAMVDVDADGTTVNSSDATLSLPAGAQILYAGLYWGAESASASRDTARFALPGGSYQTITAADVQVTGNDYAAVADVTPLLAALADPNGTYRVGNVQATTGTDQAAGWALVLAYRDTVTPAPLRSLTIFDGYAAINTANPSTLTTTVSGFLTPAAGLVNAEVGMVTFEGDLGYTGDQFRLNGANMSDAANPLSNTFNGSISRLGASVTSKSPNYANQLGFDIDLLDATGRIPNSATSATLAFTTSQDVYYPTVFTFAVDVFQPLLIAPKAQRDVNGGVLKIGDEIEYTIDVTNLGNDAASEVVLTDPMPVGTTYKPGSASILSGANAGPLTDQAGDDTGEFSVAANSLVVRLGAGATSAAGGRIDPGETIRLRFRAVVAGGLPPGSRIQNQANLAYRGLTLGGVFSGTSDADDGSAGDQPTDITLNLAPTAADDAASTTEDLAVAVNLPANDTDPDGNLDPTTVTVTGAPNHGDVAVNPASGVATYTPDPDWWGTDTFTYRICDDAGDCDSAVATISVTAINDPPLPLDDVATTDEDVPVTIAVLANDTDPDDPADLDPASVSVTSGPAHGSLTVNPATGAIRYTPAPDWHGADSFIYQVCDAAATCATASVDVTVDPVNDRPVPHDDSATTPEDTPVTLDVLANDTDPDGTADLDPTSLTLTTPAAHGTTSIDPATGEVTYTPDPDYAGADAFVYQVCDMAGSCATATAAIDVGPVNDPPVAVADAATVSEDGSVEIDVVANDHDPDGPLDPASVAVTSGPAHGTTVIDPATGRITYTPDPDWNGADTFTYQVCDGPGACSTATVTLTVSPANDAPIAVDDAATTGEDAPVTVDVLANDDDVDGNLDPTTVTVTSGPDHGVASVDPVTGEITYTPAADWHGSDSLRYRVCDLAAACASATLDITVSPVPDPPLAVDDTATTNEDAPVVIDVLANDFDPESDLDPTSVSVLGGPAHGLVAVSPVTGRITYTPGANYNGSDTFSYQVCDATAGCSSAVVRVTVVPVPDAPVAADDVDGTAEDTPVTVDVLANDADADGDLDPASVALTGGPAHGSASVNPATGAIRYLPDPDWSGLDSLAYRVCDALGACATATVSLTVSAVNDPPIAADDAAATDEDTPVRVDVVANDNDPDGALDPTSVSVAAPAGHGALAVDPVSGAITYTPVPNWHGTDTFDYQVCDLDLGCDQATVTLTVRSVNDAPTAADDAGSVAEDASVVVDVLANDADVDGNLDPGTLSVIAGPSHGSISVDPLNGAVTYAPGQDYAGPDALTYRVCDTGLPVICVTASLALTVTPVNDAPVAGADSATLAEDGAVAIAVLANDADVDGPLDPASVTATAGPAHGSLALDPVTGIVTYTPAPDYAGPDAFTYRVCDMFVPAACALAAVSITVTPVNDVPDAADDSVTPAEDTPVVIDVLANDGDADGFADLDPASVAVTSGPAHGTLVVDPLTGAITYTPDPDYNGQDSFTYQVCDRAAPPACTSATVSIAVLPVNDPPAAAADAASTAEDTPVTVDVLANDADVDGFLDPASVGVIGGPAHGTLVIDPASGAITYTPDPDYNGPDGFTYQVCDQGTPPACATAAVTLDVQGRNDLPVAADDAATTDEDTPVSVDVAVNDTDPENALDPTTVSVTGSPLHGSTAVDPVSGAVTYTPDPDYSGPDAFTYRICDTGGGCATAVVSITVVPTPDPPTALDDAATTAEETPVVIPVVANDVDPDGNLDPTSVTVTVQPGHGTLSVDPASGAITYTPAPDFTGSDGFAYQVCDGGQPVACSTASVTVAVTQVNDPPVAADDAATTDEDTPIRIGVTANDSDIDGNLDITSLAITAAPAHGTLAVDPATGAITYSPARDWNGADAFTYRVCDTGMPVACATATALVTVAPVADPPVPGDDAVVTGPDQTVVIDVIGNDTDPDDDIDPTSVSVTGGPANGTVAVDPLTGRITYTPNDGFAGVDTFTYRVCDATGNCRTATVSVAVSVPSTFTFVGPGNRIVQVPGAAIVPVGALLGILVAILFDRRRRRREWRRMLHRVARA